MTLNRNKYTKSERIFQKVKGQEKRLSSAGYCSQLKAILDRNMETVVSYIRKSHANAYGLRKGGATYAVSGTTAPPDTTLVCTRAEWSMSKVLDAYLHFAQPGDCYLGRVLACLDPLKPTFNILPPHFNVVDPFENHDIVKALDLMYRPILDKYKYKED